MINDLCKTYKQNTSLLEQKGPALGFVRTSYQAVEVLNRPPRDRKKHWALKGQMHIGIHSIVLKLVQVVNWSSQLFNLTANDHQTSWIPTLIIDNYLCHFTYGNTGLNLVEVPLAATGGRHLLSGLQSIASTYLMGQWRCNFVKIPWPLSMCNQFSYLSNIGISTKVSYIVW